ncbi:sporulation-control protein [Actinophytocola oryzae]|uniref:Sporulation-control protein n=2 Tax=Actinophytocola oryzae TaxID=502181 RepID=A0A4R7VVZ0_9PSEU|nr:sporulation-control protein [Actinophytocola oryzae]
MLSAFGVGAPSVDTVLETSSASAGEVLRGRVNIQGGSAEALIDQVVLSLVTRVEVEQGGHERAGVGEFHRAVVSRDVKVPANERLDIPFTLSLPWETPITAVGGNVLPGMTVGVRTELVIKGAPDKGDLDPVLVSPLPSQDAVLEAFGELGATFRSADVEAGRLVGVPQSLPFYQEIEFFPPSQFAGRLNQVELTFVATPRDLFVVLEADKRGGMFRPGGDTFGHFHMSHEDAERADWTSLIGGWLQDAAERAPRMNPAFGGGYGHQGHHGHPGHHGGRRGPGMGAVVGGAAAGLVGGMIIGDMMDGGLFDGDEGGEDMGGGEE